MNEGGGEKEKKALPRELKTLTNMGSHHVGVFIVFWCAYHSI